VEKIGKHLPFRGRPGEGLILGIQNLISSFGNTAPSEKAALLGQPTGNLYV
jgi:hypothetical protein